MNKLFLIVGLGNPGAQYEYTRHNIGFRCIDSIANKYDATWRARKEYNALVSNVVKQDNFNIIFCKPQTYMNLSGAPVLSLAAFYKIKPENIIVVHDEIDLVFGRMRYKFSGGNAGHNGLKSISSKLSNDYHRIRFGIGRPQHQAQDVAKFVLEKFTDSEEDVVSDRLRLIVDNIEKLLKDDIEGLKHCFSAT